MDEYAHTEDADSYNDASDFDEHADAHGFEGLDGCSQGGARVFAPVVFGPKKTQNKADEQPKEWDDKKSYDGRGGGYQDGAIWDTFASHGAPGED